MNKTVLSIIVAIVLIGGAVALTKIGPKDGSDAIPNNVFIVDGKQIIEIKAKGGYIPRKSIATAGLPTILRFNTKGTVDCSMVVLIPSLGISKNLPISGVTDIDLGAPAVGKLAGSCGMGMFPFELDFES